MEPDKSQTLAECLFTIVKCLDAVIDRGDALLDRLERYADEQDARLERYEKFFREMKDRFLQDLITAEVEHRRKQIRAGKVHDLSPDLPG